MSHEMVQIVGAEDFWELLLDENFRRDSKNHGYIGTTKVITKTAPEDLSGFIEEKLYKDWHTYIKPKNPGVVGNIVLVANMPLPQVRIRVKNFIKKLLKIK